MFTQYAGEILKMSILSKARVKEFQSQSLSRLVIGCRSTTELQFLRPALAALRRTHPDILPVLRLIPFDALENLLREGTIHMMFSFRETAPSKGRYLELFRCPVMCVCIREHPLAALETVTLEQLQQAGRIAACRPPACPPVLFQIQGKAMGNRSTDEILFCDQQECVFPLVEAGYAFALVPGFPGTDFPGLRYIPLAEVKPLSFGAVYLTKKDRPALSRFLTLLDEYEWDIPQSPLA